MTDPAQAHMLGWLARMLDAKVIVEAGTYRGSATRILAKLNPQAHIWTADPYTYTSPVAFIEPNISFYQGDFLEMLAMVVPDPIDFAYIDATPPEEHGTKHTYRYRHRCGVEVAKRLSPNGIIAWDDTNPAPWKEPFPDLARIKEMADVNFRILKGLSLYQNRTPSYETIMYLKSIDCWDAERYDHLLKDAPMDTPDLTTKQETP